MFRPKATPNWFGDAVSNAIKNGEDLSIYRNMTIEHIRDVVTRYKGRNTVYKIFNEVIHGEFYRKNFPGIWDEAISVVRAADPEVQLMINDYQIISGDASHGAHYGQYGEFRRFIINMP